MLCHIEAKVSWRLFLAGVVLLLLVPTAGQAADGDRSPFLHWNELGAGLLDENVDLEKASPTDVLEKTLVDIDRIPKEDKDALRRIVSQLANAQKRPAPQPSSHGERARLRKRLPALVQQFPEHFFLTHAQLTPALWGKDAPPEVMEALSEIPAVTLDPNVALVTLADMSPARRKRLNIAVIKAVRRFPDGLANTPLQRELSAENLQMTLYSFSHMPVFQPSGSPELEEQIDALTGVLMLFGDLVLDPVALKYGYYSDTDTPSSEESRQAVRRTLDDLAADDRFPALKHPLPEAEFRKLTEILTDAANTPSRLTMWYNMVARMGLGTQYAQAALKNHYPDVDPATLVAWMSQRQPTLARYQELLHRAEDERAQICKEHGLDALPLNSEDYIMMMEMLSLAMAASIAESFTAEDFEEMSRRALSEAGITVIPDDRSSSSPLRWLPTAVAILAAMAALALGCALAVRRRRKRRNLITPP